MRGVGGGSKGVAAGVGTVGVAMVGAETAEEGSAGTEREGEGDGVAAVGGALEGAVGDLKGRGGGSGI